MPSSNIYIEFNIYIHMELNSMRFFLFLRSQKINMEVFKRSNLNQAQLRPPHCHDGPLVVAMANSRVQDKGGGRMFLIRVG